MSFRRVASVNWIERSEAAWKQLGWWSGESSQLIGWASRMNRSTSTTRSTTRWCGTGRAIIGQRCPRRLTWRLSRETRLLLQEAASPVGNAGGRARLLPATRQTRACVGRAEHRAGRIPLDAEDGHRVERDGDQSPDGGGRTRYGHEARAAGASDALHRERNRLAGSRRELRLGVHDGVSGTEPNNARDPLAVEAVPTGDV